MHRLIIVASMLALLTDISPLYGQVMLFGVKAGAQYSWVDADDDAYREATTIRPRLGYNAGFVLSFKIKERYFLHSEYLFSTKGKVNKGINDKMLEDRVIYNYIEVPLLYNIQFKGSLGNGREFKWYAGAGPLFSYWLGGRGWLNSDEFVENNFPPVKYKIRFGDRGEDLSEFDVIYVNDVNRFQLGANFGGGILLEPATGGKVMIDLRFEWGHTWMGTPTSADYVVPVTYDDNLQTRNMGLRFSVMYLFEQNTDKKVRNKGKSTLKQKGRTIKRRR